MGKFFTSIPVLVAFALVAWFVGFWGAVEYEGPVYLSSAQYVAGVPILVLFFRKAFRLGWMEDFEPVYTLEDANITWTPDNQNAFDKAYSFIDQARADSGKFGTGYRQ